MVRIFLHGLLGFFCFGDKYLLPIDHYEPYTTTEAYLDNLVCQHTRLLCENPESVADKGEYYEEYRCLQTIKMLTTQIVGSVDRNGPLKLFLDDVRFGNILVDPKTFEINALIDGNSVTMRHANSPMSLLLG